MPNQRPVFWIAAILIVAVVSAFFLLRGCGRGVQLARSVTEALHTTPSKESKELTAPGSPNLPRKTEAKFKMQIATLLISRDGLRLDRTTIITGRVKAPPASVATDRLEFEAWTADNHMVFTGSLDHPLHRRLEYEDPQVPGKLCRVSQEIEADTFDLRIPAELAVRRVVFFEVRADRPARRTLGEVLLQ